MNKQMLLLSCLLAGCASNAVWHHPEVSPTEQDVQFKIDHASCLQVAHGAAPMPAIPASRPDNQPVAYNVTTGPTIGQYTYSTITPQPGYRNLSSSADWAYVGAAWKMKKVRREIYEGCMTQKGWREGN